jgi:hypothetical protein
MDKTIDMAREAGFETMFRKGKIHGFDRDGDYTEELKAFEALVRADERETCAKLAEAEPRVWDTNAPDPQRRIAAAIRARGTHDPA